MTSVTPAENEEHHDFEHLRTQLSEPGSCGGDKLPEKEFERSNTAILESNVIQELREGVGSEACLMCEKCSHTSFS